MNTAQTTQVNLSSKATNQISVSHMIQESQHPMLTLMKSQMLIQRQSSELYHSLPSMFPHDSGFQHTNKDSKKGGSSRMMIERELAKQKERETRLEAERRKKEEQVFEARCT